MRRIALAVTLVGTLALTGCSGDDEYDGRRLEDVDAYAAAVRWWGGLTDDVRATVCRGPLDDARPLAEVGEQASIESGPFVEALEEKCAES